MNDRADRQERTQLFLRHPEFRTAAQSVLSARARDAQRRETLRAIFPPRNGRDADTVASAGGSESGSLPRVSQLPLTERMRYRRELNQLSEGERRRITDAAAEEHTIWQQGVDAEMERRRATGTGLLRSQSQEPAVVSPDRSQSLPVQPERTIPVGSQKPVEDGGSLTLRRLAEQKRVTVPPALAHEEKEWSGVPVSGSASEREQRIPFTVWGVASTGTGFERRALIEQGGLTLDLPNALGSGRILVANLPGAPDNVVRFEVSFTKTKAPASLRGAPLGDTEILVTPMTKNTYAERETVDRRRGTNTLVKEVTVTLPKGVTWDHLRHLFETS